LRTAHEKGYYEWPRDRTAEEIADALDIASSTLHQHLRAAENKLISAFLSE
jgi:predicted DNA binding protein